MTVSAVNSGSTVPLTRFGDDNAETMSRIVDKTEDTITVKTYKKLPVMANITYESSLKSTLMKTGIALAGIGAGAVAFLIPGGILAHILGGMSTTTAGVTTLTAAGETFWATIMSLGGLTGYLTSKPLGEILHLNKFVKYFKNV